MSVRNRGGKWHYRFKVDGREYAATTGLAATKLNLKRAQAMELELHQSLLEGRHPTRKLVVRSFNDAADDFLTWAEAEHQAHPNTYKRLATSFTSLKLYFAATPVGLIDGAQIEAYKVWRVTEHEVRLITLRHDLHALSKFFGYGVKQNWNRDNPVRNVSIPSDTDAVRIHLISAQEEAEYFKRAAKNQDLWDLARLIRNQGMRPEEVTSLLQADVDLERGQVSIRKGKSAAARRTLDLTPESKSILARRLDNKSKWVFPSKRRPGKAIARLNRGHDAVCAENAKKGRAALSFVLYDWRHSFATKMAQAGVDLSTLAAILGHASIRLVQKYVHISAEHKKAAMVKYGLSLLAQEPQNQTQQ
jgi:integrase